jgi:hypothetical protein
MDAREKLIELAERPKRTMASLSRLERAWIGRRGCGFCDAPLSGSRCYAPSGSYVLPVIEGVRDKEELIDLGPPCNLDERRAAALKHYKPRARAAMDEKQP